MIEGSQRIFKLLVSGLKAPLCLKFNYIKDIPTHFTVEVSYQERMSPIEASYSNPMRVELKSD